MSSRKVCKSEWFGRLAVSFKVILMRTRFIFNCSSWLGKLFPSLIQKKVEYIFKRFYIVSDFVVSSTSRILHTRVRELDGRSHRTGAPLSVPSHSNVRVRSQRCWVSFSESDFEIPSACERNRETLLILESMYILRNKPKNSVLSSAYKLPIC